MWCRVSCASTRWAEIFTYIPLSYRKHRPAMCLPLAWTKDDETCAVQVPIGGADLKSCQVRQVIRILLSCKLQQGYVTKIDYQQFVFARTSVRSKSISLPRGEARRTGLVRKACLLLRRHPRSFGKQASRFQNLALCHFRITGFN